MIPTPEDLVRKSLLCVGHFKITTGHFWCDLYAKFVELVSGSIMSFATDFIVKRKMVKMIAPRKKHK